MLKMAPKKGRSRYFLLFLYFLLSALIVLALVSIPLYVYTAGALGKERAASNTLLLTQIRNSADTVLSETNSLAMRLLSGRIVNDIAFKEAHRLYATLYDKSKDIWDVQSMLSSEMQYHPFVQSIYICFDGSETVLTDSMYVPLNEFFDKGIIDSLSGSKMNGWLEARFLNANTLGTAYTASAVRVVTCFQKTPVNYSGSPIVVVINIDTLAFSKSSKYKELHLYLVNSNGDIVVSSDEKPPSNLIEMGLNQANFQKRQLSWNQQFNGIKVLVTSLPSNVNDWRYFILLPYSSIVEPLESFRKIIILTMILCVGLALVLAILLSRHFYRPIQQLTEQAAKFAGQNSKGMDDFKVLNDTFLMLMSKNRSFDAILQGNRKTIMDKYVLDMMTNRPQSSHVEELRLKYATLCVLCLRVENPPSDELEASSRLLMLSIVEHVCSNSLMNKKSEMFSARLDDKTLAIVVNSDEKNITAEGTAAVFRDALLGELSLVCSVGVSRIYGTPDSLQKAFGEAKRALSYSILYSSGSIIPIEDILEVSHYNEDAISVREDDLIASVRHRDVEVAHDAVNMISSIMRSIPPEHFFHAKFIVLRMCQKLADLVSPVSNSRSDTVDGLFSQYRETENAIHLQDLTGVLTHSVDTTIAQLEERALQLDAGMISKVLEYIRNHYDEDFGLTQLAGRVGIHPAYLGRLLKKATGKSFNDIITGIRYEKVVELLKNSDMNINDIFKKVGYNNRQSFLRAFRGECGMTPSEFRNKLASERLSI